MADILQALRDSGVLNTGRTCFEPAIKDLLTNFAKSNPDAAVAVINFIPNCADVPAAAKEAAEKAKRGAPVQWSATEGWQGVTYINEKGKEEKFDSPSALCKKLDISTSGIQCDPEGKMCRSTSQVESIQIHGFTVYGNGEGQTPAKGITKHITVIHPKWVAKMNKESKKEG